MIPPGTNPAATPERAAPGRQGAWTEAQITLLVANPTTRIDALLPLLADVGPGRTRKAVSQKRQEMSEESLRSPSLTRDASFARLNGWPHVPPPEEADRLFVQRLVVAAKAEGLLRVSR